jgi:hypothetical protein
MSTFGELTAAKALLDDPALLSTLAHAAAQACMPATVTEAEFERAVRDLTYSWQATLAVRVAQKVAFTQCISVVQDESGVFTASTIAPLGQHDEISDIARSPNLAVASLFRRLADSFERRG